jgi:hypothetical protein
MQLATFPAAALTSGERLILLASPPTASPKGKPTCCYPWRNAATSSLISPGATAFNRS